MGFLTDWFNKGELPQNFWEDSASGWHFHKKKLDWPLEENGDQIPRMVLEEQMEQLNIIQGNCCRLMRPSVLWLEQLKYVQKNELSGEALFLDRELSNFV